MAISLRLAAVPTDEEILELSRRNPGYQFERTAAGELVVTPAGSKGGRRDLLLGAQLHPFCPDVVFEIASQSDTIPALRRKMYTYLANGGRLAVLIDPQRRVVEVYAPDADPVVLARAERVSLDPVLRGCTLDLRPIFE